MPPINPTAVSVKLARKLLGAGASEADIADVAGLFDLQPELATRFAAPRADRTGLVGIARRAAAQRTEAVAAARLRSEVDRFVKDGGSY